MNCRHYLINRAARVSRLLLLPFVCLMFAFSVHAQTITATVSGTVTDPNGAVVPGATVTVTSTERGGEKTATTDDEGRYTVPFLQPGVYDIAVEGAGFGRNTVTDVRLEVAQVATIDVGLTADVQESVEVEGSTTPLLQTETSQLETTIEQKLLEDLPTNNRNIFNFIQFVPGTIDAGAALGNAGGSVGSVGNRNFFDSNFSVNGGRSSSNDVLLDGVSNTIGDFNGVAVSPPQDAIREFKVQSGVAPADFGRTGGGIVNIVTRAGTNRFHGSLYEYFQNKALNANGFIRNRNPQQSERIDTKRNQFGGSIGGPVYLPRFGEGGPALLSGKNRTFFFFNYEARREDNPFARDLLTVPTPLQRTGNLSELLGGNRTDILFGPNNPGGASGTPVRFGQIFNPYGALVPYLQVNPTTGATTQVLGRPVFPNNDISNLPLCASGAPRTQACLDPVALNVLGFIPQPNTAGQTLPNTPGVINNFQISQTVRFTRDIIAGRIDQRLSENQQLFGRFSYELRDNAQPDYFNSAASNTTRIRDQFGNATANHVFTITPTIVNNVRYGYTRVRANQIPNAQGFDPTSLGLPASLIATSPNLQFPDFTIGGGADGQTLPGQLNSGSIGGAGNNQPRDTHTIADAVTFIRGGHTIRTGGEYRLLRFYPFQFFTPSGSFSFDRIFTRGPVPTVSYTNPATAGSALASFLLGLPSSGNRETVTPLSLYHHYGAGFIQDDYKIRRNLTLNLGLRYDFETGTGEANNLVSNFDFNQPSPLNGRISAPADPFVRQLAPNFTDLRGLLSFPEGAQTRANRNRFAPRIGFAYSLNNKTTVRGGYGLFFLPLSIENPSAQGTNFNTNLTQSTQTTQVGASTVFLTNPFPNGIPDATGNRNGANTLLGGTIIAVEPERRTGYNQLYNLVVSRELARNVVLDVAYVGSKGVRLPIQQLFLNQLSPETLAFARANYTQPNSCSTLTAAPFTLNTACSALPNLTTDAARIAAFLGQQVANPFANQIPGSTLNGAFTPRAQLLRPFPQYQGVTLFRPLLGESSYNALQVNLQKRFSDGLSVLANYTFSKLMDTGGTGNGAAFLDPAATAEVYNYRRSEYSLSTLDIPHRFTSVVTYELPFGRGRRFGKDLNRFANFFLGGYQVSGTAVLQSGTPLLITSGVGFDSTGAVNSGVGTAVRRPNRIGQNSFDDFRERARNNQPVIDQAAFEIPAPFEFGTASRTSNDFRRDPYKNLDLSIIKNFTWNEGRQRIQLRGEFLNALNYVVFGTPGTVVGNANFGLITSQGNTPRIVQLVGRYTF